MFERINSENNHIKLVKTNARIRAYGTDTPIELCGEFHTTIKLANDQSVDATFYVTKAKSQCILGCESSTALGLITLNVNNIAQHENPVIANLLKKHEKRFNGTGNLKGLEVKLEIDDSIPPVAQSSRRIPHNMKKKLNEKLREMREDGIIEKVDGATPWLSPLVLIPKPKTDDVRLVLDMRVPNTALIRRRIKISTVDEILHQMEGAKVFTEVDLSQGYLQLTLAEESRYITAFTTPDEGPHRFTRLIMEGSPFSEYFHEIIHDLIKDVPGCENISDNIWLWSDVRQSHYKQLEQLLTKLESSGLTLKLPKCSFAVPQINVFGHIVSGNEIQPDNAKIEAVNNAPPPQSVSEVRSFLGLTNHSKLQQYHLPTSPAQQSRN